MLQTHLARVGISHRSDQRTPSRLNLRYYKVASSPLPLVTHLPVDPGHDADLVGAQHDEVVQLVPLQGVQTRADLGGFLQLGDVHLTKGRGAKRSVGETFQD